MFKKLIPLAILPLIAFAQPAEARRLFWWQDPATYDAPPPYQDVYGAPDEQGLYGAPDERFNGREYQLYQREMNRRYGRGVEIAPEPTPPYAAPRKYAQPQMDVPYAAPVYAAPIVKPKIKKIAKAKPVAPAIAPVEKQVASTPPVKAGGTISCEKGASIVSGFGFDNVKSKSCAGGNLAYNAERGGKPFEIDVNPKTGELIAVKKLDASKEVTDQAKPPVSATAKAKDPALEI